jgi:hypothetical protein
MVLSVTWLSKHLLKAMPRWHILEDMAHKKTANYLEDIAVVTLAEMPSKSWPVDGLPVGI